MNSGPEAGDRLPRSLPFGAAVAMLAALGLGLPGCAPQSRQNLTVSSDTRMGIADIASAGGDTEAARAILAAAAQTDPNNGELQLHYAAALLQSNRPDDALGAARPRYRRRPRRCRRCPCGCRC